LSQVAPVSGGRVFRAVVHSPVRYDDVAIHSQADCIPSRGAADCGVNDRDSATTEALVERFLEKLEWATALTRTRTELCAIAEELDCDQKRAPVFEPPSPMVARKPSPLSGTETLSPNGSQPLGSVPWLRRVKK
jgi:hypothetical protein